MIRDQLFLFPELNYFKQKIKNIDYCDISELDIDNEFIPTKFKLKWLQKNRFILWKTGGVNTYMKKLGPVFPYIEDTEKGVVKTVRVKHGEQYLRIHLNIFKDGKRVFYKPYIHVLVARAFIKNPEPTKFNIVHHIDNNPIDYRPQNLQYVNQSINMTNTKRPKFGTAHDNYMMNTNTRVKK